MAGNRFGLGGYYKARFISRDAGIAPILQKSSANHFVAADLFSYAPIRRQFHNPLIRLKIQLIATLVLSILPALLFAQPAITDAQRAQWKDLLPDMATQAVTATNTLYPLSDQSNARHWVFNPALSDEFNGTQLDSQKWWPLDPLWKGRQPGWFDPRNVKVADGCLQLTTRLGSAPADLARVGFNTYTTAFVKSKQRALYGYYEVRAQPMKSSASSSFWFYAQDPDRWTEIDVYEINGKDRPVNETVHVWHTPECKDHWAIGSRFYPPTNPANDFHVYGLEWTPEKINYYYDGALVRTGPNTHFHQSLNICFDSETFPDWFGLPKAGDLPSTYK
jgi:hypothetical protein